MGSFGDIWYDNNFDEELLAVEKRRHVRYFLHVPIQYGLISGDRGMLYAGHTLNLSRSGLCIVTSYPLRPGQEITIGEDMLPVAPGKAAVRWMTEIDDANPFGYSYVVGLEFEQYISDVIPTEE